MSFDVPYVLREATAADVSAIHGMICELAEFEQLTHLVVATEADLHQHLCGDKSHIYAKVVEDAGEVVAFALYFRNYSTFAGRAGLYLEDLYVKPAARGRGYAKALLKALAAEAVERGFARFEWSVLDWNQNAIDMYEAMGAVVMPEWRICRVTGDALTKLAATA